MQEQTGNLAHLATITSRPEALVIASALEHAGIETFLDGMYHCSIYPYSVALGGHRLRVYADKWEEASAVVREIGLPRSQIACQGQQRAVLRILALYVGPHFFLGVPAVIAGIFPPAILVTFASLALGVPTDPRGQNDWHLAQED